MSGLESHRRPPADAWTRRDVMRNGMASVAGLYLLGHVPGTRRPGSKAVTPAARRAQARAPFEPFRRDLPIPPELVPTRRSRTEDVYECSIREAIAEILPGFDTPVYGYDGIYPGPTIRARKGRRVLFTPRNALPFHSNVHLHGGLQAPRDDGHPQDLIMPGGSFTYRFPNDQDAATLWYHDHAHGANARTIYFGLAGFYLLEDDVERDLDLPRDAYDVPLLIQDRSFNRDGSLRYAEDIDRGFLGDTILVNGAVAPRMRVERRLYRFRFLNGSNARDLRLRLGRGRVMRQIGSDGGLLEFPLRRRRITLSPAERADVVIDFRDYRPGTELVLHNELGERSTVAVMRFDVARGGGSEEARVPRTLRPLAPIPRPNAERSWVLSMAGTEWHTGGRAWDPNRIDCRPRLGTSELWQFVNRSQRVHPMHIHGSHFRVIGRSSGRLGDNDRGWKDTVRVAPDERVTVQPYIVSFPGRYVFHCHALEHATAGMMLQMEVVE
jgi:FtsP/CotA-like multicopper oxidase with cupredoxin domain